MTLFTFSGKIIARLLMYNNNIYQQIIQQIILIKI
jgi:hypothetical protein